jgi:hypothetical protein
MSGLKLTLSPSKNSVLNKITCKETVQRDILTKLMCSDLLKLNFHNPFCENKFSNELEQLRKYEKLIEIDSNEANIIYQRVKGMSYGRCNPRGNLALFSIRREIRQTLSYNLYTDIDIANAHPVFLLQICKANNIETKYLDRYINNRDTILEKIIKVFLPNIKSGQRDIAKNLPIRILYLGTTKNWLSANEIIFDENNEEVKKLLSYFKKLELELETISKEIYKANPKLVKEIEKCKEIQDKEDYNIYASVMSYFLQEYECKVLETIFKYLKSIKVIGNDNNCSLCADGLMVLTSLLNKYLEDNKKTITQLLEDIQDEIKINNCLKLKLEIKPFKQHYIDILDNHIIKPLINKKSYEGIKTNFELTHFKVENPLAYIEILENNTVLLRNKTDFFNLYENIQYETIYNNENGEQKKNNPFIKEWFKDPSMRTYKSIDFLPNQKTPDTIFNSFKCYNAEKLNLEKEIKIEDTLIYKHMDNLCGNDKLVLDYFIKFLSRKIQEPHKLTNTCLIFRSAEGVGKDTFFNWFGNKIIGKDYYLNEDKINLIFGKFNSCIENKILVIINETSGKDTFELQNTIKNAITRPINTIEKKGMTPYDNTNNIGYICLTNNKNAIKVDAEDRRICAIECNNTIANDYKYFTDLHKEINDDNITKSFFNYFMSQDVKDYDFTNSRPKTNFYNSMKDINIPLIVKFLENECNKYLSKDINTKYYTKLYEKFNNYIQMSKSKYEMTETKFGIELKEFIHIEKKRGRNGIMYLFDFKKTKDYLIQKYNIQDINNLEFIDDDKINDE